MIHVLIRRSVTAHAGAAGSRPAGTCAGTRSITSTYRFSGLFAALNAEIHDIPKAWRGNADLAGGARVTTASSHQGDPSITILMMPNAYAEKSPSEIPIRASFLLLAMTT